MVDTGASGGDDGGDGCVAGDVDAGACSTDVDGCDGSCGSDIDGIGGGGRFGDSSMMDVTGSGTDIGSVSGGILSNSGIMSIISSSDGSEQD